MERRERHYEELVASGGFDLVDLEVSREKEIGTNGLVVMDLRKERKEVKY